MEKKMEYEMETGVIQWRGFYRLDTKNPALP